MKEKLTRNIGLKILSVILASALWLVITNIDNPLESKSIRDVKVQILNENSIKSDERTYVVIENDYIDFTVRARRSIKDDLTARDFKVTADFHELTELADVITVPIKISAPGYGDEVVITDGEDQKMKIRLEDVKEESFKVNIVPRGEVAEGFHIGEKKASPNLINVKGPKNIVENIDQLIVEVDVTDASTLINRLERPKVIDEDGNEMDASKLSFSENYVAVELDMLKTKTVTVEVKTTGDPQYGYGISKIEYDPTTVLVAGKDYDLRDISKITIVEDVSGASDSIATERDIRKELPEGILLVGEDESVAINILVEKMDTKEFTLQPNEIDLVNKSDNINVFMGSTPIKVTVMGLSADLDELSITALRPYIDLETYRVGSNTIDLKLKNTKDNIVLINKPVVNCYVTYKYS